MSREHLINSLIARSSTSPVRAALPRNDPKAGEKTRDIPVRLAGELRCGTLVGARHPRTVPNIIRKMVPLKGSPALLLLLFPLEFQRRTAHCFG